MLMAIPFKPTAVVFWSIMAFIIGMARNLAISFRLERDFSSLEANAKLMESSHKKDFSLGI
jgi:HAMP domain-containing protein